MPHSSGGGSSGGGFHGGFGYRGSLNTLRPRTLVKTQWFAGSRLYLKRNPEGYYEYVYSNMLPSKAKLAPIVLMTFFLSFLFPMMGRTMYELAPGKINPVYSDMPAVHDEINIINDDEGLAKAISEYQQETGICPVIYTVYKDDYTGNLKDYTYNKYVGTFPDEQHFVIVYAVSKEDAALLNDGKITVPDFAWEAVQGDETDVYITVKLFNGFGNVAQNELMKGTDPGIAFSEAFRYALDQKDSVLATRIIELYAPVVFVGLVFVGVFVFFIVRYWKEKDVVYEEIPMGSAPKDVSGGYSGNVKGKPVELPEFKLSKTKGVVSSIGIAIAVILCLAGIAMLALGIALAVKPITDTGLGVFFIVLGAFWILMGGLGIINFVTTLSKFKKTTLKPKASAPESKSGQKKSDTVTAEDDDYNRMKNRGFE